MKNQIINFLESYLFGIQIAITIVCFTYMVRYVINRLKTK